MEYPPTTHYLTMKLNWMARKLKAMNDLPTIKDWMEAMNCVFKTLQAFSSNKELSAPMPVSRRKLNIQKAHCITVKPIHSKVKTIKTVVRPIMKGKRSCGAGRLTEMMKIKKDRKERLPPRVQVDGDETEMDLDKGDKNGNTHEVCKAPTEEDTNL